MATLNVYLNFMGNTLEVFEFYKSVFGWEFTHFQKFKDIPNLHGADQMSPEEKEWIMHIELPVFKNMLLMWTDLVASFWHTFNPWNNISLSLNLDSKEQADDLFTKLSVWWEITMPLEDAFWWAYFWMCTDKFWIQWMFNYQYENV